MPVGWAGTAAGAMAPLSLEVLGVGRGDGMLENSCQEVFSVSVSKKCHRRKFIGTVNSRSPVSMEKSGQSSRLLFCPLSHPQTSSTQAHIWT